MSSIIQAQGILPLFLNVSTSLGSGLIIHGISLGDGNQFFSLGEKIPAVATSASVQTHTPDSTLSPQHPANFLEFVQPDQSIECPEHDFQAYLIAESPRMIYIESFLSEEERQHVMAISNPYYTPAMVYNTETDTATAEGGYRRSETAILPRDSTVKCIERRAQSLQQWTNMALEPLSVQRYQKDGYFVHHHDGFGDSLPNRMSTFNVWLDGNCTGGGTHFPMIPRWEDPALCAFLDCEAAENGTVFKPIAGNALFWQNVAPDGKAYEEMVHAGLVVLEGTKIGLNIWSWVFPNGDFRGQSI
ncbi:hypothetical protein ASPZODRAFT_147691 [Penicilliopsis zonata CBS 506.65]|uniref:Prolyl 4-hydroxylase alpha subunit domain-containing protein n=1 Tax=Penicilliopsis zonata CBS 506.65 TaxID=1073090 RepID=A0A1L9S4W5_9EURO|nr:hypothetical protein ASPZODRAFT_147691 [Penicilliopsis zonata CBS 506.65]OJJ42208.1 hypothetical protein ASPZODRAFT_147691 [Penicilliopsis zonata CBS 506.65]